MFCFVVSILFLLISIGPLFSIYCISIPGFVALPLACKYYWYVQCLLYMVSLFVVHLPVPIVGVSSVYCMLHLCCYIFVSTSLFLPLCFYLFVSTSWFLQCIGF